MNQEQAIEETLQSIASSLERIDEKLGVLLEQKSTPLQEIKSAFEVAFHQTQEQYQFAIKVPELFEPPCIQTDE